MYITQISKKSKELFNDVNNYHDARYDTTATYLLIIEGLKQGYIPKNYFTNLLAKKAKKH